MMRTRALVLAALLVAMVSAGYATTTISPEQVGNYSGTYTTKTYNFNTGTVETKKLPLEITLEANDSYTVSTGGSLVAEGTGFFAPGFGSLPLSEPSRVLMITLHFKGTKVKGQFSQTLMSTTGSFTEGKIAVKKVP
jgi:hypothetical protein